MREVDHRLAQEAVVQEAEGASMAVRALVEVAEVGMAEMAPAGGGRDFRGPLSS